MRLKPGVKPMTQTRGERDNNPMNIREYKNDGVHWRGERATDDDPAFEEFETPKDGIRAGARVLLTYYRAHHLDTIRKIINRWSPNSENNTLAYIAAVSRRMSVDPDAVIDLTKNDTLQALVTAIIFQENGRCIYAPDVVALGVQRAFT